MVDAVKSNAGGVLNKTLRNSLVTLRKEHERAVLKAVSEGKYEERLMTDVGARQKNTSELCSFIKEFGWPTRVTVGEEGVDAAFSLLRNNSAFDLQIDLLPVIIAASEKGEIDKSDLASYFDRLRLGSGLKQLFGTQTTIIDGFLVLLPIEAEATLDQRRKDFGLVPLSDHIRSLERIYLRPLIRSTGTLTNQFTPGTRDYVAKATTRDLLGVGTDNEDEVIRVNTNLVSINVSVYSEKSGAPVSAFEQKDFRIIEDGRPQETSFFATTEVPFDLILVLDLSGSTYLKRDLIRKSTKRFIEAARPSDRVAIVTFADSAKVIAPLTDDRSALLKSADKLGGGGYSRVWDALRFTLSEVVAPKSANRRTAIVFMTDGLDTGSKSLFSELLEAVRTNDALIVPVYLHNEPAESSTRFFWLENARKTLKLLAEESGGFYYEARKIENLNGVYERVIADLGRIYSLGYRSDNQNRDGSWRRVEIAMPGRPELKPHSRPGYYAK